MLTEAQEKILTIELQEYIAGVVFTVALEQKVVIADVMLALKGMWQLNTALNQIHALAAKRTIPSPAPQRRGNLKHLR